MESNGNSTLSPDKILTPVRLISVTHDIQQIELVLSAVWHIHEMLLHQKAADHLVVEIPTWITPLWSHNWFREKCHKLLADHQPYQAATLPKSTSEPDYTQDIYILTDLPISGSVISILANEYSHYQLGV